MKIWKIKKNILFEFMVNLSFIVPPCWLEHFSCFFLRSSESTKKMTTSTLSMYYAVWWSSSSEFPIVLLKKQ